MMLARWQAPASGSLCKGSCTLVRDRTRSRCIRRPPRFRADVEVGSTWTVNRKHMRAFRDHGCELIHIHRKLTRFGRKRITDIQVPTQAPSSRRLRLLVWRTQHPDMTTTSHQRHGSCPLSRQLSASYTGWRGRNRSTVKVIERRPSGWSAECALESTRLQQ